MVTYDEAIAAAGDLAATQFLARQAMTPREQAEAAFTPTSRYSVDELEDLIRVERGMEPIHAAKSA